MKKVLVIVCALSCLLFTTTVATADSINGRLGLTGRIGILAPSDTDAYFGTIENDAGFIGGGGLIFGLPNNFALEVDATYASFGGDWIGYDYDFTTTNLSFGLQYRFANLPVRQLVPYVGGGVDIIWSDVKDPYGQKADIDTVVGGHVSGGVDYFIARNFALTAEVKLVVAPEADIMFQGVKQGEYDPTSFSTTFGFRVFFN